MPSLLAPARRLFLATASHAPLCEARAAAAATTTTVAASSSSPSPSAPSSSRPFSTSPSTLGKSRPGEGQNAQRKARRLEKLRKMGIDPFKKEAGAMKFQEAFALLRALEIQRPHHAYELHIKTSLTSNHQRNALRGRVSFAHSPALRPPTLIVFAMEETPAWIAARAAREAGQDIILGGPQLVEDVANGKAPHFDKVLAGPEIMPQVNRLLARNLGPKGLMPAEKRGTVAATEVGMRNAIAETMGALDWKGDNSAIVRAAIGRIHFTDTQLRENLRTMLGSVLESVATIQAGSKSSGKSGPGSASGSGSSGGSGNTNNAAGAGAAGTGSDAGAASSAGTGNSGQGQDRFKIAKRGIDEPAPLALVKMARNCVPEFYLSSSHGPGLKIDMGDVL